MANANMKWGADLQLSESSSDEDDVVAVFEKVVLPTGSGSINDEKVVARMNKTRSDIAFLKKYFGSSSDDDDSKVVVPGMPKKSRPNVDLVKQCFGSSDDDDNSDEAVSQMPKITQPNVNVVKQCFGSSDDDDDSDEHTNIHTSSPPVVYISQLSDSSSDEEGTVAVARKRQKLAGNTSSGSYGKNEAKKDSSCSSSSSEEDEDPDTIIVPEIEAFKVVYKAEESEPSEDELEEGERSPRFSYEVDMELASQRISAIREKLSRSSSGDAMSVTSRARPSGSQNVVKFSISELVNKMPGPEMRNDRPTKTSTPRVSGEGPRFRKTDDSCTDSSIDLSEDESVTFSEELDSTEEQQWNCVKELCRVVGKNDLETSDKMNTLCKKMALSQKFLSTEEFVDKVLQEYKRECKAFEMEEAFKEFHDLIDSVPLSAFENAAPVFQSAAEAGKDNILE